MSDPTELRQVVASEHDLPDGSAAFLAGDTLEQVEASATALKSLLQEHPGAAPGGLHTTAATAKADRQRALLNLFAGPAPAPPPQPRDERGRFTGGFDGGARASVPPPPETHDSWLGRVLRTRAADSGAAF